MSQGRGLNVVRHLPGRDASLRRMYPSHGVPVKASTDGRSKKFAVAIAQSQRAKCVRRPNNPSIVSMSEVLGIKTVLLSEKCSGTVPPSNKDL